MRCHFTATKGASFVRGVQYRLFLIKYLNLAAKVTKQRLADKKPTIMVRYLLSEVEIETIRKVVNHAPSGAVEPLQNATNEKIVEPVIEEV